MGKTTVVIDDKLLQAAIEEGLKELVHRKNMEGLRRELGTFDFDLTLTKLERLRKEGSCR